MVRTESATMTSKTSGPEGRSGGMAIREQYNSSPAFIKPKPDPTVGQ